jgi:hypothetical protein
MIPHVANKLRVNPLIRSYLKMSHIFYLLAGGAILLAAGYTHVHQLPYPRFDQWFHSIRVAEGVADGTLSYRDLVRPNYGHRMVFPSLTTAFATAVADWNLAVEAWIGFAALVGAFTLVVLTVRRVYPAVAPPFALLGAMLMFSLRQHTNFVWTFSTMQWFYWTLGVATCVYLLFARERSAASVPLLLGATVLSAFSSGAGLILIPLVTVGLVFCGYRRVVDYVLWLTGCGVIVFFYFRNMEENVRRVSPESLNFNFPENSTYIITMLTGPFIPFPRETHPVVFVVIFVAAMGLGVANLTWLYRKGGDTRLAHLVLFLAGIGVSTAVMTSLGRSVTLWWGAQSRLFTMSVYAWLALVLSALVIVSQTWSRRRLLTFANVGLLVFVAIGQVYVNGVQLTSETVEGYAGHMEPEDVQCYWGYLINRSPSCIQTIDPLNVTEGEIDGLFERRLAHFRTYDGANPVAVEMPNIYRSGEPVIISGPRPEQQALSLVYRDLDSRQTVPIPPGDLARLMEPVADANPQLVVSAAVVLPGSDAEQLAGYVRMADRVWHLRADGIEDYDAELYGLLTASFEPVRLEGAHWRTTVYDDLTLWLRRPDPILNFGENIRLIAWEMASPVVMSQCESIETRMLWHSDGDLPHNYSLALVLADEQGVGQHRIDVQPGGYTTSQWEVDAFYHALDALAIPCDLPTGDYLLLAGLYVPGTGEGLTASDAAGTPIGELAYLTTISVR